MGPVLGHVPLADELWRQFRSRYSLPFMRSRHKVPSLLDCVLIIAIAALFIWSAQLGHEGALRRWATIGVAALGLFAITLLGSVLPSIDKIWPARELARAVAKCPDRQIDLVGFPRAVRPLCARYDTRAANARKHRRRHRATRRPRFRSSKTGGGAA